ncbi:putative transcriptional regulatory protein PB1A11.04c [Tolypocladium ophioglossoides CBS 100239]|uniref:Putative transcriptional regulatory protein PB1A11.04c n=1 Tax=Tolypocladium ophioglossoides (strain CBS 100239) TaxID=1163406 RepID=A0A0L0NLS4_TOLOC|nr:putative transcriptional regulatory protein PB1A11.04c [Tolypocladium ophioglossoides CBS 100239]
MDPPAAHDTDGPAALASANAAAAAAAASASSDPVSPPTKRRRTAPILADCCRTCRLRKVKCSGNPGDGPCTNCFRLDLTCNFTNAEEEAEAAVSRTTPSHSHTEAGTLRKRAQRACSQCHSHKTKCSGDLPRCKRCEAANLPCEYTPAKRKFTNVRIQNSAKASGNNPSTPGSTNRSDGIVSPTLSGSDSAGPFAFLRETTNLTAEDLLSRKDLLLRHVDAYMDNMYWLPSQGFIHPDNTCREIQEGTLDPAHAAGICAVASFFVNPHEEGRDFGQRCSTLIELYLFNNVSKFSDGQLILFALNITYNVIQGSITKVWQCFGIASRLMLGLRINWHVLPRGRTFIQQESLRRIGWHFFHIDRVLADGFEGYISCRAEHMKIPLPCNEAAFRDNRPVVAERLYDKPGTPPNTINLHAFQIRLIDLRHRIKVTTNNLCSADVRHVDASQVMADINGLQNELTRFHASLPADVLLSDQSVSRYMAGPERPGYVLLHCHLAGSHIDLYRMFLPSQSETVPVDVLRKLPREFIARSQKQAVAHAMSFGRFCDAVQNEVDQMTDTGKLELAGDYSTIQLATTCVRVLLVALQQRLYRDITKETTAPLWRMGKVDESHIRFLIKSIQRVTEPWCGILRIAQLAYDHNKSLVDEFDKTRKVAEQRPEDKMLLPMMDADDRLPGTESFLESIAAGIMEDPMRHLTIDSPVTDRWLRSSQMSIGEAFPYSNPQTGGIMIEPGTPGIPILLAQARTASMDPSEMPTTYDGDNTTMELTDLTGSLPDGNVSMPPNDMSILQMNGSIDPVMYQQAPPAFMMAQQGVLTNGYATQYAKGQGDQKNYGQQPGFG